MAIEWKAQKVYLSELQRQRKLCSFKEEYNKRSTGERRYKEKIM